MDNYEYVQCSCVNVRIFTFPNSIEKGQIEFYNAVASQFLFSFRIPETLICFFPADLACVCNKKVGWGFSFKCKSMNIFSSILKLFDMLIQEYRAQSNCARCD